MLAVGKAFTTTVIGVDVEEQLNELLTVTECVPVAATVIDCVVAPFDHKYVKEFPVGAESVTLPP
jgi:hypothetical protein